jgi:hypothetical protein
MIGYLTSGAAGGKVKRMNLFEWQAMLTEKGAEALAHWVETTEEGRLNWKPSADSTSDTRNVLELAQECITVNYRFAAVLSGAETPAGGDAAAITTAAQAREALIASGAAVAAAIRGLDESALGKKFTLPIGELPGALCVTLPLGNMQYHGGQVNYIQRLYGDTEFRVPASFRS